MSKTKDASPFEIGYNAAYFGKRNEVTRNPFSLEGYSGEAWDDGYHQGLEDRQSENL